MAANPEPRYNIAQINNECSEYDVEHCEPKTVRRVFTEEEKNDLHENSKICVLSIYYRTDRGEKLCGVCVLEIGGERFSKLTVVRKHESNHWNMLYPGSCSDCRSRLYQVMTRNICPDCRDD